ncbi:hypothetical protein J7M02_03390 [Candidatus Aerophobetes bacterium]|nr:hypothetical protein [Candidatus Aerophobetes bacterium]
MGFSLTKDLENKLNNMNPAAQQAKLGTKIRQLQIVPDDTKIYFGSDQDVSVEYDEDGNDNLAVVGDVALTGDFQASGHSDGREFLVNAFQYPNPGTDWTPTVNGAVLSSNLSSKKVWLPLNFLKIGDEIVSYRLVGDMVESAGKTCTLDCTLYRINKADPITKTAVAGGTITQVTADGNFDVEAVLDSAEVVATDKQYTLEIQGTTDDGANDAITVIGAEVKINRKV